MNIEDTLALDKPHRPLLRASFSLRGLLLRDQCQIVSMWRLDVEAEIAASICRVVNLAIALHHSLITLRGL